MTGSSRPKGPDGTMAAIELDSTRLERLRTTVKDELAQSVWEVDGQRVEAADRDYWLDMSWLLGRLNEVTAYAARMTNESGRPWVVLDWLQENNPAALELCPYKVKR